MTAERLAAERMSLATDPLVRLQMAGITPEVNDQTNHYRFYSLIKFSQWILMWIFETQRNVKGFSYSTLTI